MTGVASLSEKGDRPRENTFMAHVGVVGVSFKTAPIAAREDFVREVTPEKLGELRASRSEFLGAELVLLSTCNRIEIFYYCDGNPPVPGQIADYLASLFRSERARFEVYRLAGLNAIAHAFQVAAGLDSLVIGEAQILSQVRDAARTCSERGLCGPVLSRLFAKACETARNVREENSGFSSGPNNSVSRAVLELIFQRFGGGKRPNLLLVGSGKMIRLAVRSVERTRIGSVVVAARRPVQLPGIGADEVIQVSEIGRALCERKFDVVIAASSAGDYVVRREHLDLGERGNTGLLVLDISVPRNVDPSVADLPGVELLNLDDLRTYVGSAELENSEVAFKVRNSVALGAGEFAAWLDEHLGISPVMNALRRRLEAIRAEEFESAMAALPGLTEEERAVVERMSERLARRLLHDPSARLREMTKRGESAKARIYALAVRDLFSPAADEEKLGTARPATEKDLAPVANGK